jgi:hypothetical protein
MYTDDAVKEWELVICTVYELLLGDQMAGACKGDMRTIFYSEYLKGRNQAVNVSVDTRIILKRILNRE